MPSALRRWGAPACAAALVLAAFAAAGQPATVQSGSPVAAGQGQLTDPHADPHDLHVDCRGARTDKPTVVFEAGAFGTSADWDLVLQELAVEGRVCAYDRAGLGASPPRDRTPRVRLIAQDLRDVLDRIGETQPVILVGHSNGALYVEAFARLWPERVAGIAFVNGVVSDALHDPRLVKDLKREERLAGLAYLGGRLHLAGLVAASRVRAIGLQGDAARRKLKTLESADTLKAARDEDRRITRALASVNGLPPLNPRIPTAILVSSSRPPKPLEAAWRDAELAPARRACRSWTLDLPGGTHVSPLGRDRIYVVVAVRWLQREAMTPPANGCTPPAAPTARPVPAA